MSAMMIAATTAIPMMIRMPTKPAASMDVFFWFRRALEQARAESRMLPPGSAFQTDGLRQSPNIAPCTGESQACDSGRPGR